MPKVSTLQLSINGEQKMFPVHYSKNEKFTLKDFPADILKVAGVTDNEELCERRRNLFPTEADLKSWYDEVLQLLHEKQKTTRKVIVYSINATQALFANYILEEDGYARLDVKPGFTQELINQTFNSDFGEACQGIWKLGINFRIMFEQNFDGLKYFHCNPDGTIGNQNTVNGIKDIVIDYTPEREVFFQQVRQAMSDMLLKILQTMINPAKLVEFIDANQKLIG